MLQGQSTDGSEGAVLARLWHLFESLIITALKEKCWRKYLISLNKHEYHVFINEIILLGAILALFLFILAPPHGGENIPAEHPPFGARGRVA